jgi:hypothetical protein
MCRRDRRVASKPAGVTTSADLNPHYADVARIDGIDGIDGIGGIGGIDGIVYHHTSVFGHGTAVPPEERSRYSTKCQNNVAVPSSATC